MKVLTITNEMDLATATSEAAVVLKSGGVILYPTDTMYGLGVDALSDAAVCKLYTLKGRREEKPLHAMIESKEALEKYGVVTKEAGILAKHFLPGPLSLVLKKLSHFNTGITKDKETIGLRVPNHQFCQALCREFPHPITATSANVSGMKTEGTVAEVLEQFGEREELIDLVIDAGTLPPSLPSTVVDVSTEGVKILREGALSPKAIHEIAASKPND